MNTPFDLDNKIRGSTTSTSRLRKWITTIDGECPSCSSHSLIKYMNAQVIIGCLVCGWKEIVTIDQLIQTAFDDLKRTLEKLSVN